MSSSAGYLAEIKKSISEPKKERIIWHRAALVFWRRDLEMTDFRELHHRTAPAGLGRFPQSHDKSWWSCMYMYSTCT